MSTLLLLTYLAVAVVLQVCTGNFPLAFMAFPLNVIFAAVWIVVLVLLYRQERPCGLVRYLLSREATFASLYLIIGGCLVIGLFPQLSEADASLRTGIAARLGCYRFTTSWSFLAILLLLQSHLLLVTLRGMRRAGRLRGRFLLSHAGLWLALFAGFWGAADKETLRLPVYRETATREAVREDGRVAYLDYEARLHDFRVEYFDNGMPAHYEAYVSLDEDTIQLTVNHPYAYTPVEEIYLSGYDVARGEATPYCVLQVVREPWKYVTLTGILMLLAGACLLFIQGPLKQRGL